MCKVKGQEPLLFRTVVRTSGSPGTRTSRFGDGAREFKTSRCSSGMWEGARVMQAAPCRRILGEIPLVLHLRCDVLRSEAL